jgi:3-deoxy-D-manno-octulosonic-acid transferase
LVEGGGADFVRDASDMEKKIDRVLSSPDFGEAMGQKGKALVERLRGATNRTVEILCAELRQKER